MTHRSAFHRAILFSAFSTLGLAVGAQAAPFALSRDTVDLRTQASLPEFDFLTHAATDSLVLDSVSIRLATPPRPAQLDFYLTAAPGGSASFSKNFNASNNFSRGPLVFMETTRLVVKAQTIVRMSVTGFDNCVFCPTAKRSAAQRASAIGDTLKAWVRFHSGANVDSVLFLGKERVSSGLTPGKTLGTLITPPRPVDAAGRAVKAPARHALEAPGTARARTPAK